MADQPLDYELVRRAVNNRMDGAAWDLILARMTPLVARVLRRTSPDLHDVVNKAAAKVYVNFKRFNPAVAGSIDAWVAKIAWNTAIDHCRRSTAYAQMFCNDSEAEEEDHGRYNPSLLLERCQDEMLLDAAIEALDPEFRVVIAFRLEQRTYEEIARELGISTGTAKSRCHRAAVKIQDYINARTLGYTGVINTAHGQVKRHGT